MEEGEGKVRERNMRAGEAMGERGWVCGLRGLYKGEAEGLSSTWLSR